MRLWIEWHDRPGRPRRHPQPSLARRAFAACSPSALGDGLCLMSDVLDGTSTDLGKLLVAVETLDAELR